MSEIRLEKDWSNAELEKEIRDYLDMAALLNTPYDALDELVKRASRAPSLTLAQVEAVNDAANTLSIKVSQEAAWKLRSAFFEDKGGEGA